MTGFDTNLGGNPSLSVRVEFRDVRRSGPAKNPPMQDTGFSSDRQTCWKIDHDQVV